MRFVYGLILMLICWSAQAQPVGELWARTYGGAAYGSFERIKQTADGGYVIGGSIGSVDRSAEFWMMKVNPAGDYEWSRSAGTGSFDILQDLIILDDGYVLAGISEGYPPAEEAALLIRLNANGDSVGSFHLNDYLYNHFHRVAKTLDGGVFAVGDVTNDPTWVDDWILVGAKLDADLEVDWLNYYLPEYNCRGFAAIATADSGYALGCSPSGLLRIGPDGSQGWFSQVGQPNSIVELPNGGFAGLVSSSTHSTMRFLDSDGELEDVIFFNYGYDTASAHVHMTRYKDEGFVFPVDPASWTGQQGKFALARLDSVGDSLWISEVLASDWTTTITDIVETREGGFALCGNGSAPGQGSVNWIFRTTPDGSIIVTHSLSAIREGDGVRLRWLVNPELTEVIEGYRVYGSTSLDVPFETYLGFATDTTFVHESALAESDLFYYFVVSKYGFAAAAANRQGQGALKREHSAEPQNVPARTPFYGH